MSGCYAERALGAFASDFADAASPSRYQQIEGSVRFFGGYNVFAIDEFYQIPPRCSSASLAIPLIHKKTEGAKQALELMWADGGDSWNFFIEHTFQKRIDDPWYASVM